MGPEAANMLAEFIGADLGRLDNELAKIALSCEGNSLIGTDAIRGCVAFQREQELKEMTNLLALGDSEGALRMWRRVAQLDASAEFRAVTWLTMWLEDVGQVWDARHRRQKPESMRNYWKYKFGLFPAFLRTVDTMGQEGYRRAVSLLAEVDKQTKTGVGDAATNVERFILALNPH
jgi:DNA polymerase III delta subunit